MHDPLVVAFEIRRPWPRRSPPVTNRGPRWHIGWSPFWTLAGRSFYFPSLVTVWHREPGGHDSGEICRHYRRGQRSDGTWSTTVLHGWRLHVNHWRIQVPPLQGLRRRLLTRCEWCGGRSRKRDAVNVSHSWNRARGPWWRGERGLFHLDCSGVEVAHRSCLCDDPILDHDGYGNCARCGCFRAFGLSDEHLERRRELAAVPAGKRAT